MTVRVFGGWDFAPRDSAGRLGRRAMPAACRWAASCAGPGTANRPAFGPALNDPTARTSTACRWSRAGSTAGAHARSLRRACRGSHIGRDRTRGKLPPSATRSTSPRRLYTNTIGAPLAAVLERPGIRSAQRAFYYVRVMEIPTPRWIAFDAKRFGVTMPPEVTMELQERAYTSPVWYTP